MNEQQKCPICNNIEHVTLYAPANYDLSAVGDYAFASRKLPEYMHYKLMRCEICNLVFSVDTLSQDELSVLYRKASFDSGQEASLASRTYMHYLKKYAGTPKGKVMDIGTGEGSFLRCLLNEGVMSVVGVEPSEAPIEVSDKDIRPYITNTIFQSGDYPAESFDLISCFQTMEHIPDPVGLVSGIRRLLKEGGMIYVVSHDHTAFVNRMLGKKSPIYDIEHLQIFSRKSMEKLLRTEGFTRILLFTVWNRYPVNYWIKLLPIPEKLKRVSIKVLDRLLVGKLLIPLNVGNFGAIGWKSGREC